MAYQDLYIKFSLADDYTWEERLAGFSTWCFQILPWLLQHHGYGYYNKGIAKSELKKVDEYIL